MRLRDFYLKVGLFGLLLLFCVLFGVSLASGGMERIEGAQPSSKPVLVSATATPVPGKTGATVVKSAPQPTSVVKDTTGKANPTGGATPAPVVADHDNSLNRVGNKLGDLLQITMHHGIKLFVSIFDAVLGKG
ncbi:DUF3679 domain-containing protein [Paenibacillus roseipurpureus]|uniref:DUF3679 domain-containing protein n=1 Tax=Paenibacillus roseopurpureus TaxID=2918901 RepID=A0AA96RKH4_9BACL|nr:DUF3679 domain-containing protein [Paenibacillus sp. MBLB1832]WNR46353.1 DUF3679 domain-containing protein [Paenibacillus sp. MBLB1832]